MSYSKSLVSIFIVALIILSSCRIGGNLNKIHVANNPTGDHIRITLLDDASSLISGELLSIHGESVILLNREMEILEVYYSSASSMIIGKNKKLKSTNIIPNQELVNEFRVYGRYPQGINDELKASLLSAYNQESFFVIK